MAGWQNGRTDLTHLSTACVPVPQSCNLPFLQFSKYLSLFVVQTRVGQQIRPPLQRSRQRLAFPPPANLRVIAGEQHVGDPQVGDLGRPRELREVEQPDR